MTATRITHVHYRQQLGGEEIGCTVAVGRDSPSDALGVARRFVAQSLAPTPTVQQEAAAMDAIRQVDTDERRVVLCLECGQLMAMRDGKHGQYYAHPNGTALGCRQTYDAAWYDEAKRAKQEQDAKGPAFDRLKPPDTWTCPLCGAADVPRGECCSLCKEARRDDRNS